MSNIRIDDHSEEYLKEVEKAIEAVLEGIGGHIEGEAKEELENSPRRVDTGLLANSITYALDGEAPHKSTYSANRESKYTGKKPPSGSYSGTAPKEGGKNRSVIIGTNVEYALYIHEGTSANSPNRFLKNAVERNKDQITDYIKKALN